MRPDAEAAFYILVAILGLSILVTAVTDVLDIALGQYRDMAAILQAIAAVTAIVLGALFAWRNSLLFRTFEPHLSISHYVSHRNIGASYVHIAVIATLHNSSRVRIEVAQGFFQLLQVAPIDDADVETLYAQALSDNESGDTPDIQWPLLRTIHRISDNEVLIIEPGQSHLETVEFIVSRQVESVLIYSYFGNQMASWSAGSASGWSVATPYDIAEGN